ncbi:hypothetical protein Scep_028923 [Stephania cephalantha]|uniref:U-box domain-containing protein n=1 Tax=Stephania cephalantha TaxID=152367 RepID=A0AAP0EAU3_9MAGN
MVSREQEHSESQISSSSKAQQAPRSMRTIRSNAVETSFLDKMTEYEYALDAKLAELAKTEKPFAVTNSLEISQDFSEFSACSSDISGELQRLACACSVHQSPEESSKISQNEPDLDLEPWLGFLQTENLNSEILDSISPEDLQPAVMICIKGVKSPSPIVKRSAAAKLRVLAKNREENRALIAESGAIPALIPLLGSSDPWTQENAATALLNLSLNDENKLICTRNGAIKPLIHVLKTGTEVAKQNAACALLSLALVEQNVCSIGASGAIAPLVSLLMNGTNRGMKDSLTTLYKLCSIEVNKERAVNAGVVKPLLEFVSERRSGVAEKAMVVLSSLAGIEEGRSAIVEEGGMAVLVEAIEDGTSMKGKEFAVATLLQMCSDSVRNRGCLVREGAIPPLVALSQTGSARAKRKAEILLGYLREPRPEASARSR